MENIKQYVFGGHTYLFVKIIKKIKKHSFSMISYSLSNRSPVTFVFNLLIFKLFTTKEEITFVFISYLMILTVYFNKCSGLSI